jgi:hypothetical protein
MREDADKQKEMTKQEVAQKVRERLDGITPGGVALFVKDDDVYKVDNWWRVPVSPSRWPKRMSDFYEDLATVTDDLQEAEHLNILLETGEPLDEEIVEDEPWKTVVIAEPEIREHYGFENGQRGQDAHLFPQEPHVVVLSPDVAAVFPDSDSVNEALRVLVKAAQASVPKPQEREAA